MPDDYSADTSTTGILQAGSKVSGVLETLGDSDWFRIDLVGGQTYEFSILSNDASPAGPLIGVGLIQIHDSAGKVLEEDLGGVHRQYIFDFTPATSGTYFISAAYLSGSSTSPGAGLGGYTIWARPFATLAGLADYLINGFWAWDNTAHPGTYPPHHFTHTELTVNLGGLTPDEQSRAMSDLSLVSDVTGLHFTLTSGAADIIFDDSGTGIGQATSQIASGGAILSSTVQISRGGLDPYRGYLHELGHALGLGHAGPYNGGDFSEDRLIYGNDNYRYSQMAAPGDFQPFVTSPQMADIYALQLLYGANNNTRLGNTVYGFNSTAGSTFDFGAYSTAISFTIYDSGGIDTLDASRYTDDQRLDLRPGNFSSVGGFQANIAIYPTTIIENAIGGSGQDTLIGNDADNTLTGGAGNDTLDGGGGWNTAAFSGPKSSYQVSVAADGGVTVTDLRGGSPDGTDKLSHIQFLSFSDGTTLLGPTTAADAIALGFSTVLRQTSPTAADQSTHDSLVAQASAGSLSISQAAAAVIHLAQNTSSVATLAYQFFTGSTPRAAGMDFLVSPTGPNANNLNSAYYQSFNIENRYINFAVNLGKLGAGAANFSATYGGLSLFDATKLAYGTIFGITPSDTKVHALLDPTVTLGGATMTRADYFAYYGADGASGIGTKAAMVGWLLAEAVLADKGTYALSNDAFLTDVALHGASFGVDIMAHYNQASFAFNGG